MLMCPDCQALRGHGPGPYLAMTRAEMRASLEPLPPWVLEQKADANRQVVAVMASGSPPGSGRPHVPGAGTCLARAAS